MFNMSFCIFDRSKKSLTPQSLYYCEQLKSNRYKAKNETSVDVTENIISRKQLIRSRNISTAGPRICGKFEMELHIWNTTSDDNAAAYSIY